MTGARADEGDSTLVGISPGLARWGQRLLFFASVLSLLVVVGEAIVKIQLHGVEECPGARLLWLEPHLGSFDRLGYANGLNPGLESARHFYRARYALAPRMLTHVDVIGNGRIDLSVLDFETVEQLHAYCQEKGLEPIVIREDGTGLAGSLKEVHP